MNKVKLKRALKGTVGVFVVFAVWSATFTVTHLLTEAIYTWIGWMPTIVFRQVINAVVGLFLLAVIGTTLSRIFARSEIAKRMQIFTPLIDAMAKIARGDFSVRVEHTQFDLDNHRDSPIAQLFVGVNHMAQSLNQMEMLRQEFVSNVSHEIQSPLASIRGFAQALRSEQLDAPTRLHYLDIIEMESTRLSKLSDNLMALTSLEAGTQQINAKPYRLDQQIKRAILTSEPQWMAKHIDIGIESDQDSDHEDICIVADEDLLSQVWTNLIHNAIKFTPNNGRITVSLQRRVGWVDVAIADNGIGIAVEDQSRIFERFYKADSSRNRERSGGGSGLGLAIVAKIIDMHHGRIEVRSEVAAGATFVVSLPLSAA